MLSRREVLGLLPVVAGAIALPINWQPVTLDDSTSHEDLAREFVHLSGVSGWLQAVHREAFQGVAKTIPEQFSNLDSKFTSEQFWEEQKLKNADVVNAHPETSLNAAVVETQNAFSRAELIKLIDFFRSSTAKKMIEITSRMPALTEVQANLHKTILTSVEPEFAKYYKA